MPSSPLPGLAALALLAALVPVRAHDAVGEYFFGADPGPGQATPLAGLASPPALSGQASVTVPSSAAPGDRLRFGLRFRDAGGRWGQTVFQSLHVVKSTAAPTIEWSWPGSSTPAQNTVLPADGGIETVFPAVAPRQLLVRARTGGIPGPASFWTLAPVRGGAPARLLYAFDRSPDPATASSFPLTEASSRALTPFTLSPGNLPPGFHSLHLRVLDAAGAGTEEVRFLHVMPSSVQTLAGLAYTFRDAEGTASTVSVVPLAVTPEAQDIDIPVPATLAPGEYTLLLNLALGTGNLLSTSSPGSLSIQTAGHAGYTAWSAGWGLAGEAAGMMADPDEDRLVNLLEYAFGLDPYLAETAPPYTLSSTASPGGTVIEAIYRQRSGGGGTPGHDYTAGGLRYTIEASTDLQAWLPFDQIEGLSANYSTAPNGDGTETVHFSLHTGQVLARETRVFVRLNVSVVP